MNKAYYALLMLLLSLVSCVPSKQLSSNNFSVMPNNAVNNGLTSEVERIDRKILYSAYLSLAVDIPDSTTMKIEKIANTYEGYVQQSGSYRVDIRVKSEKLDAALIDIESLGIVKSKNVSGQDVTSKYFDYQIRLENAEKSRERYLELLDKAENVSEMLQVEKELERLNETIELLKGQINRLDHFEEFSTITVTIKERKKPGILGYVGIGLYKPIKWLFVRN